MSQVDYLILTPLYEEWAAFKPAVLRSAEPVKESIGSITYRLWHHPVHVRSAVGEYLIVAAPIRHKTPAQDYTAAFLANALHAWQPSRVLLIGIAGNLAPDKVNLGDVVVSDRVLAYVVADAKGTELQYRPEMDQTKPIDLDRVGDFLDDPAYEQWRSDCATDAAVRGLSLPRSPILHIGEVASGNDVVKSAAFRTRLKKVLSPNLLAVEMEAHGMYVALRLNPHSADALTVRGVSDHADRNKTVLERASKDAWRAYATANVARFIKILLDRGPLKPVSAGYKLHVTHGGIGRFRQKWVPEGSALYVPGAQNLAFPDLIDQEGPTPELFLSVRARDPSGSEVMPVHAVCMVGKRERVSLKPVPTKDGHVEFKFPPSSFGLAVELLLSFPNPIGSLNLGCFDLFGRSASATYQNPDERRGT